MTRQELLDNGYEEQLCKIGNLYFKGHFFCKFKDNETVDYRSNDNDMKSLGTAKTITEIKEIEKNYYITLREQYLLKAKLLDEFIKLYNNKEN